MENLHGPIFLQELLPKIDQLLIDLLRSLSPEDWKRSTISPKWKVKDIAAHLLDGNFRTLSMLRDNHFGESPSGDGGYEGMVQFLNKLNSDWVQAMQRISPEVLIALLESSGKEYCLYIDSLDPFAKATFSVGWAGEEESLNWFHIAREYTEKWHHQQQIRLAVGQEAILYTEEFYWPCLDTFMRALPFHYRTKEAEDGEGLIFVVEGDGGGEWYLESQNQEWQLIASLPQKCIGKTILPEEVAWKFFTKGISQKEAISLSSCEGKESYANHIFSMIAIMG